MIHFTHFQTFLKIPEKGLKFQSKDKIPKSESTVPLPLRGNASIWSRVKLCFRFNLGIHCYAFDVCLWDVATNFFQKSGQTLGQFGFSLIVSSTCIVSLQRFGLHFHPPLFSVWLLL